MAVNKYQICSNALVMVGGKPISSFLGQTPSHVAASELFEPTARSLLSKYRWRFCSIETQLTRMVDKPMARWDAVYQEPAGVLRIHGILVNGSLIEYDRYKGAIHCNAGADDTVIMDHTYYADLAYWPDYFAALLRLELAAVFAIPVAEDLEKASLYQQLATREFAIARNIDSQSQTARKIRGVGSLRRFHGGAA